MKPAAPVMRIVPFWGDIMGIYVPLFVDCDVYEFV